MGRAEQVVAELALAEQALEEGELRHAAHHAAAALALAPTDARALALVDRLLDERPGLAARVRGFFSRPDPAPLFAADGWSGNEAVRARASYRRGDHAGAFRRLTDVAAVASATDYTPWFLEIVEAAGRAGQTLEVGPFVALLSRRIGATIGLLHLRPLERAALVPWAEVTARLVAASAGREPMLAVVGAGVLRRVGRVDESLAMSRATIAAAPPAQAAFASVQLGLALRACGALDEACRVFEDLADHQREANYLAEAARARFDQGRFDEALALFERAGPADRERGLAVQACRWALGTGDGADEVRRLFPEGMPRYDDLVRAAAGDGSSARMGDASMNALAQMWAKSPPASLPIKANIETSCLEPPSVLLALALATRGRAEPWELDYTWTEAPGHDPREPINVGGARLWKRRGKWPEQALAAPRPETVAEVAAVAARPIPSMRDWRARAARARVERGELLAALIHPPLLGAGVAPGEHVSIWQLSVALIMAAQGPGEPWLRSARRESLRSLILGPPDWTAAAALIALTELLLDEPDALDEALEWLAVLVENAPDRGHNPWEAAMAHLAERVPGVPAPPVRQGPE